MAPERNHPSEIYGHDTQRLRALDGAGQPLGESSHIWEGACTLSEVDRLLSEIISLDDHELDSDTNRLAG